MAKITINIPDEQLQEFIKAFLRVEEIPRDDKGDPIMTESQWLKDRITRYLKNNYQRGQELILKDQTSFADVDIS